MSDWNFFPANDQALRLDGVSQLAYRNNPSFRGNTAGAISMWVRVNALLPSTGVADIISCSNSASGATETLVFGLRRHPGFPDPSATYIGLTQYAQGSSGLLGMAYAPTPASTGGVDHYVFGSSGKVYLNSVLQSTIRPAGSAPGTVWFGDISGSNRDLAIGGRRIGGTPGMFSQVDVLEVLYLPNRVFTGTEVSEIHGKGMGADFESLSMYSELAMVLPFDGDANDIKGSNHFTLESTATPTPVLPTFIDV